MRNGGVTACLWPAALTAAAWGALAAGSGLSRAVVSVAADIDSFNEYVASSTFAIDVADQLFLGLMDERPAPPGGLPGFAPRLARSWDVAPDGLSVTFHLRDDVRWSDGRPTTADDVVFTWRAQVDPALGWPDADLKRGIRSVTAVDPRTVVFRMTSRGPYTLLDINEGHVLPRHALEAVPPSAWRTTDFSRGLVTNGPFRVASWSPGQALELAANPDYYEAGLPHLERVVFRVVPDPAVRLQQLLAGESDVVEISAPEWADRIAREPDLRVVRFDQRMYTYVGWNHRRPLFADPSVRRALTLALDRREMLAVLARGMGRPSAGPIVSSQWAADGTVEPPPYDPPEARRLLERAGWRDADGAGGAGAREKGGAPFAFDLEYSRGNALGESLALRVAAQLAEVGVRAVPRALEFATLQKKRRAGEFDAFLAARIASTRVELDSFTTGAPLNHAGYSNPRLDDLAARAARAATLDEARPLWAEAQRILAQDQPVTFLFEYDRSYGVRRRLEQVEAGPLGLFVGLRSWRPRGARDAGGAPGARGAPAP